MSRRYHSLVILQDGRWGPQFGDYSREVVEQEAEDSYGDVPKKHRKIVTTGDKQADIVHRVAQLNGEAS